MHHFLYGHCALVNSAPSIQIVCPLMNDAPLLARKTTVGAMSEAVPTRPKGVSLDHVPIHQAPESAPSGSAALLLGVVSVCVTGLFILVLASSELIAPWSRVMMPACTVAEG